MGKIKITKIILIALIISSLIFISGQEGCSPTSDTSQKSGIDFSLIPRIDTLTSGKIIQPGETFYVGIKVSNYDKIDRQVKVCITDSIIDQYGGILSDGLCQEISVPAAEAKKVESSSLLGSTSTEQITPGTRDVFFPEQGQFSYSGLPKMNQPFSSSLRVNIKYSEKNDATTTVYVPNQEQPQIVQDPSQIMVNMQKSIYPQGNAYKVNLDLILSRNPGSRIFLQDFSEENENKTFFSAKLGGKPLECRTSNNQIVSNILEIKDNKNLKCSALIYQGEQRQDYDFIVTLMYGVEISRDYGFMIDTSQNA
jgi:LysM repeat protein